MKLSGLAYGAGVSIALASMLVSCTGRRADNMVPLGETVEVVIPTSDVETDSVIASGDVGNDSVNVL